MRSGRAAIRYARALAELTVDPGTSQQVFEDLKQVEEIFEKDPEILRLLGHPRLGVQRRAEILNKTVVGSLSGLSARFVDFLGKRNRLPLLPQILEHYENLIRAAMGVVKAHVVTAVPIDDEHRERIRSRLEELTGKKIALTQAVDPRLIAGIKIRIGDRLIDGTVRQSLEKMREQLTRIRLA